jgi:outer membrane protein assembly factor BamB
MRFALCLLIILNSSISVIADENWWQFRGPAGDGHAASARLPLKWNEEENVVWKIQIHDRGWSSPVIWKNQVWMTTALGDGTKLFAVCADRDSGKITHDIHVFDVRKPQRIATVNSYATPTPVVEQGRVYVHYGTYGTACIDSGSGDIVWTRRDLKCDHETAAGPGSSPTLVGDLLVMNVDGRDVQYVIALDKATGKDAWKTKRSVDFSKVPVHERKAYCTPKLVPRGKGMQLVSIGAKAVVSYDPMTGHELWTVRHRGWSIAPRPVFGHGLVFAIVDRDHPELWAIRPDGKGDVTDSHVVWREKRGMPRRSGPLLVGDLLFVVSHDGIATCLEAKTGKEVWKNRLKGDYSASPLHAADRLYFFNEDSVCTVIRPSRQFEVLAVNKLGQEQLMASPAVAGQSLFVRTEKSLYRIEDTSSN